MDFKSRTIKFNIDQTLCIDIALQDVKMKLERDKCRLLIENVDCKKRKMDKSNIHGITIYIYLYIYTYIYIYIYISNKWEKFLKIEPSKSNFCLSVYRVFMYDFN